MIHSLSDVQSCHIGTGTRIWQFVVILPNAVIGNDCNICAHTFIENDVVLGDRVTLKSGVSLWDGLTIEDDVFIGPCVAFSNDKYPRSKIIPDAFQRTLVKRGASIGANATILPGVVLGKNCMVGAGSVVTRDVPDNAVVMGCPAKVVRYIDDRPVS
jgi:acetyltransferase-like isoleucine patch superfamily enzyme